MSAQNFLVPPKKKVRLSIGEFEMGELSYRQTILLMRELAAIQEKLRGGFTADMDNVSAIIKIFELAEDKIPSLAAILLSLPDSSVCESLTARDVSEIALALAETNDFAAVFSNFQRAAAKLAETMKTSSPPPQQG